MFVDSPQTEPRAPKRTRAVGDVVGAVDPGAVFRCSLRRSHFRVARSRKSISRGCPRARLPGRHGGNGGERGSRRPWKPDGRSPHGVGRPTSAADVMTAVTGVGRGGPDELQRRISLALQVGVNARVGAAPHLGRVQFLLE